MSDDPTRDEPIDWKLRCERAEAALMDTPQWQHAEHWKAEVKRLQEELDQHVPCAECIDEREKAEAEVERLKIEWRKADDGWFADRETLHEVTLLAELWLRSRDIDVRTMGADLKQVMEE
jgi:hypothetical protein